MRECEKLKHALGVPSDSKKTKINSNNDMNGGQRFDNCNRLPDRRDYRDRMPYHHNDDRDRRDYRLAIAATTDATTTVATTIRTGMTTARVIATMTSITTDETMDAMTKVAKMTTTATTTIARSDLRHHHLKGATPTLRSSQPTE
jgi:hypothetical protein